MHFPGLTRRSMGCTNTDRPIWGTDFLGLGFHMYSFPKPPERLFGFLSPLPLVKLPSPVFENKGITFNILESHKIHYCPRVQKPPGCQSVTVNVNFNDGVTDSYVSHMVSNSFLSPELKTDLITN